MPRRHAFAAAWAMAALVGCSVYDPSLLNSSTTLPVIDSADGSVASDSDAGASPGSMGGSIDLSAGGRAQGGGSAPSGGALGNGSGASGGSGATGSTGGAVGSTGGAVGSAGSAAGSAGGAAGSAGSAAGSAGGATGAVGGAGGASSAGGSAGSAGGAPTLKELASGKAVKASTQQTGNEAVKGNDKSVTTRWCSLHGTFPQWWRVDLGGAHSLSHVDVQFEHPDRTYSYLIETSQDDAAYTQQAAVSGTGAVQTVDLPPSVSARYLRITVTNGVPAVVGSTTYPTWASFFEISVFGT